MGGQETASIPGGGNEINGGCRSEQKRIDGQLLGGLYVQKDRATGRQVKGRSRARGGETKKIG